MWNLDSPFESPTSKTEIVPSKVLYYFDGPQIFCAKFGFIDAIYVKIEEVDESDLWLVAMTTDTIVSLIESCALSVRAAFINDRCWVVQTSSHFIVERYWSCAQSDLSEDMLPKSGVAIASNVARVPDTVEQANSYFSVAFKGRSLHHQSASFYSFKSLVDSAYNIVRGILTPEDLKNSRSSTIDFELLQPRLNSLVLSISAPLMNIGRIEQKITDADVSFDSIEQLMTQQRRVFFERLSPLVRQADEGEVNEPYGRIGRLDVDRIRYIIPDDNSDLESVEFTARIDDHTTNLFIGRETGARIHRAYYRSTLHTEERVGHIVEINTESKSFIIKNRFGRKTTCIAGQAIYDDLDGNEYFVIGTRVKVDGHFEKRKYRDRIFLNKTPILLFLEE